MNHLRQLCLALFALTSLSGARLLAQPPGGIAGAIQGTHEHKVKAGETLYGLARRYGTRVEDLRRLNGLDRCLILVGQRLKIPKETSGASLPPVTKPAAKPGASPTPVKRDLGRAKAIARGVDSQISQALAADSGGSPQRALALLRGGVFKSDFRNAKARYFLAKHYDQLAARERDPDVALSHRRSALLHYEGARDAPQGAYVANVRWGAEAKARLASRDPLKHAVEAGRVISRGDRGPAVTALQAKLGVPRDGEFGAQTEAALRDFQRRSGTPPTGSVDRGTLARLGEKPAQRSAQGAAPFAGASASTFDAYRRGTRLGPIQVVTIDGKPVARATANAFERMRAAAARDGVRITIVSGFRSNGHQAQLYQSYLQGRGNLAAPPGYSNHQSGSALDLNTGAPGVLRWLNANGGRYGFRRTVPSEDWHWEYLP